MTSSKPISSATSAWLDWIRALAAITVFAGHLHSFCLEKNPGQASQASAITASAPPLPANPGAAGLGHSAVIVFFVLSGFLVGGSVMNEFCETGGMRVKAYVVARVARIHSVLIPALVLGAAADWSGLHMIHASAVYEHGYFPHVLSWNVAEHLTIGTFLANVACLQTIIMPVFGSNGPLWSLANEFWYYFLFPALLMALWPRTPLRRRLVSVLLAGALLWLLGGGKDIYFLFWLAGVGVRLASQMRTPPVWLALPVFGATLLATKIISVWQLGLSDMEIDAIVTASFSILLWSTSGRAIQMPSWLAKCGQQLASSSYTLYACHFPLAVLMASLLMQNGVAMPGNIHNPATWAVYGGFLLVLGGACFGISLVTERKHYQLKRWLMKLV